jgi:hypothetical protein
MKHLFVVVVTVGVLAATVALSRQSVTESPSKTLQIQSESRNPWTHLRMNNDPQDFQFAIVSDRTGGHREKIFSKAVEQLNLLQPEFVLSVGDLIEGYSSDKDKIAQEWREFQSFAAKLQMPFFYVVGNHDISNSAMQKIWEEKLGRRYYHFIYKDVLFLMLSTEDPPGLGNHMSEDQVNYAKKTIAENKEVRWTIVAMHRPIWSGDNEKNGWGEIEKALAGREYTVFAGHVHRYQKFIRNGMNYYQLATTGGGSRLRGVKYGEFDHVVLATMKKSGPILANIMLDGILPENLQVPETVEPVIQFDRKKTQPVKGYVYLDGVPMVGASIGFHLKNTATKLPTSLIADAMIESDGSFNLSSWGPFDGAPIGEYVVTVAYDGRYAFDAKKPNLEFPAKYAKAATSDLAATVKAGPNEFTFELKR